MLLGYPMQFLWPCRDHPTILVQGQLTPLKIYHPYLSSLTCPAMQQTFTEHCCVGATDGGPRAVGTIIRQFHWHMCHGVKYLLESGWHLVHLAPACRAGYNPWGGFIRCPRPCTDGRGNVLAKTSSEGASQYCCMWWKCWGSSGRWGGALAPALEAQFPLVRYSDRIPEEMGSSSPLPPLRKSLCEKLDFGCKS